MATSVASPPRGAPLRALNPFGGAATSSEPGATSNCQNYLWVFLALVAVWGVLVLLKPSFVQNEDLSVNYQRVFWLSLLVTAAIVLGMCWWSRRST